MMDSLLLNGEAAQKQPEIVKIPQSSSECALTVLHEAHYLISE
jgi:hypothetical protein